MTEVPYPGESDIRVGESLAAYANRCRAVRKEIEDCLVHWCAKRGGGDANVGIALYCVHCGKRDYAPWQTPASRKRTGSEASLRCDVIVTR